MSGFTADVLEKKLNDLNNSAQSIQTLSLWLIHYRKHHQTVVKTWFKAISSSKVTPAKRLTLLYLANDVIQNGKRKGPEYAKEFATVLKSALEAVSRDCDDKTWASIDRILKIWEERSIYDNKQITSFKKAIGDRKVDPSLQSKTKTKTTPSTSSLPSSTNVTAASIQKKRTSGQQNQPSSSSSSSSKKLKSNSSESGNSIEAKIKNLPELPAPREGVIIDPDQMIKALQGLESAASKDAIVRQKIALFPKEVTDPSLVHTIRDKASADRLQKMVEDACILLSDYNQKLSQEMESRKTIAVMLATYIKNQRDSLTVSEQNLSEYREKLKKAYKVKSELKNHLQNLPDLRMLPSVMAPLPSAGDLFNINASGGGKNPSSSYPKSSSLASSSSASPSTSSPADLSDSFSTPNS